MSLFTHSLTHSLTHSQSQSLTHRLPCCGTNATAYQYRRPSDARLILATESLSEALAWKEAIENQITKLEVTKCPRLPIAADPSVIASILGISTSGGEYVFMHVCMCVCVYVCMFSYNVLLHGYCY